MTRSVVTCSTRQQADAIEALARDHRLRFVNVDVSAAYPTGKGWTLQWTRPPEGAVPRGHVSTVDMLYEGGLLKRCTRLSVNMSVARASHSCESKTRLQSPDARAESLELNEQEGYQDDEPAAARVGGKKAGRGRVAELPCRAEWWRLC